MRRGLGVVAVAVSFAVGALVASAGDVRGTDPSGDVRIAGLTAAERSALDLRSVRVVGEEGLGAFVTVALGGNLQHRLGSGHLVHAAAGIILRPRSSAAAPAGLVEEGAELRPVTVRISSKRVAHVQATSAETYRKTRSTSVGAVRRGNRLFFFILGPGFSNVAAVDVRTFAKLPAMGTRSLQQLPGWSPFTEGKPADDDIQEIDPSELSTDQLVELEKTLRDEVDAATKTAATVETAREHVDGVLHDIGESNPAAGHLKAIRDGLNQLNDDKLDEIRLLNGAINQIQEELKSRTSQPPPPMLTLAGSCSFFDPIEVMCRGGASEPVTALEMVVPGGRQIGAFLCPSSLPNGSLSQTSSPNDTLTCSGGTLPAGSSFAFNLRTEPAPSAGMGVAVFGRQDSGFEGPFAFSGP